MQVDEVGSGYLRQNDVAHYFNVSKRTVTDWTRRGILPVVDMGKRCKLYRRVDLDKALLRFRKSARQVGE